MKRFQKFLDFDDPNKLMPWKDKSPDPQGETPEDRPEVPIKPAWYFLMYFILGIGFDTLFPTNAFPENIRFTLGAGLVLAGAILHSAATGRFRKAGASHATDKPARVLLTDGPYRFSRNPIYLGSLSLYLGLGVFFNNLWIFLLGAPLFITIQVVIVLREEDYLEGKFGEEYRAYRLGVRRWF